VTSQNVDLVFSIKSGCWDIGISGLEAAILDFPHPVFSDSISTNLIRSLDLENVGISVEISSLSKLEAEI